MKKISIGIIGIICLFMLIAACTSSPQSVASGGMTLDQAIAEAASRIDVRIEAGSKIALLNFNSPSDRFSTYVLDELSLNLVESGKLTVVDRAEVDLIRSEFDFQFSGEVGDDSMQELGRMLGAQSIVSGSLTDIGGEYRIMFRVLNVQTAAVAVQYRTDLASSNRIQTLLEGGRSGGTVTTATSGGRTQTGTTGGTAQATPVQPPLGVPENGIYTFFPRLQAISRGVPVNVYIDRIIIHGQFMNIYFSDQAVGGGASGVHYFMNATHIQDLDNPRGVYAPINESWQTISGFRLWCVVFEGVQARRFSLTHTGNNFVISNINLNNADYSR